MGFKSDYNILGSGYANLDGLFVLAPWLYLFLVPAITMRLFAEEQRNGTLELLLIMLSVDSALYFVKISCRITACCFFYFTNFGLFYKRKSICWGINREVLILVAMGLLYRTDIFSEVFYAAIGVFSSLTNEIQIHRLFIIAAVISFFFYGGFWPSRLDVPLPARHNHSSHRGESTHYGINEPRVIDSRNVIYFLIVNFILYTLQKNEKWNTNNNISGVLLTLCCITKNR